MRYLILFIFLTGCALHITVEQVDYKDPFVQAILSEPNPNGELVDYNTVKAITRGYSIETIDEFRDYLINTKVIGPVNVEALDEWLDRIKKRYKRIKGER